MNLAPSPTASGRSSPAPMSGALAVAAVPAVSEPEIVPAPFRLIPNEELDALRAALRALVDLPYGIERRLRSAVAATHANPGSLWRAQLAWATGRAAGLAADRALDLACAVEAFHVASLLFDDLPAMDDAATRRGKPCVHRVYGEPAAILAGLAFVQEGHARMAAALDEASPDVRRRARAVSSEALGLAGILDGQARDLAPEERAATREEVLRRAAGKSAPLLRLALELPGVVGGVSAEGARRLRGLAEHLGLAYQLLDDVADATAVDAPSGLANAERDLGAAATVAAIERELAAARALAGELRAEIAALAPAVDATIDRLAAALVVA